MNELTDLFSNFNDLRIWIFLICFPLALIKILIQLKKDRSKYNQEYMFLRYCGTAILIFSVILIFLEYTINIFNTSLVLNICLLLMGISCIMIGRAYYKLLYSDTSKNTDEKKGYSLNTKMKLCFGVGVYFIFLSILNLIIEIYEY
jgi:small neutral amino acid transporter SnatA (MarC family)